MKVIERIETGVMLEKDGEFWGTQYEDGQSTSYGYGPVEKAGMHNPKFCTRPESLAYPGAYFLKDLQKGKLVRVRKVTRWEVDE